MLIIIILSTILVLVTLFLHQTTFRMLARCLPVGRCGSPSRIYLLMLAVFAVHLVEVLLYALGYYLASDIFGLGLLEGRQAAGELGHFYASAVFYTSLGLGDIIPNGHLRFMAGVEALNGLLLIAWSASFLFAATGQFRFGSGDDGGGSSRQTSVADESDSSWK